MQDRLAGVAWAPSGRWLALSVWEDLVQGQERTACWIVEVADPSSVRRFPVDMWDVYNFLADWGA